MPAWAWWTLAVVVWLLLQLLYSQWEQRCHNCGSWATRRLGRDGMRCQSCGHEFDF